jgi:C1A family cysteine protease
MLPFVLLFLQGGYSHERKSLRSNEVAHHLKDAVDLPESVDWVSEGAVSHVKNQGQCGSCYAFAATGTMEGAVFVATGQLASLSEQQIIDCESTRYGFDDEGCDGGLMDSVFDWVLGNATGVCAESEYPYAEKNNVRECADGFDAGCTPVATISTYKDVPPKNEKALLAALSQVPVAVAIEASGKGFQFYSKGVFDGECGTELDHGVLAVGYGNDPDTGKPFWRIKNSWGGVWGDDGYINIVRGEELNDGQGQCGVLIEPSYAIAESTSLLVNPADIEGVFARVMSVHMFGVGVVATVVCAV